MYVRSGREGREKAEEGRRLLAVLVAGAVVGVVVVVVVVVGGGGGGGAGVHLYEQHAPPGLIPATSAAQ